MIVRVLAVIILLMILQGEWLAEGIDSGTKFTGVELAEGEWYDYDEKAGEEVGITNLVWEVVKS